ncbi:hypothetical protein D3C79_941070 [compost metagenome]
MGGAYRERPGQQTLDSRRACALSMCYASHAVRSGIHAHAGFNECLQSGQLCLWQSCVDHRRPRFQRLAGKKCDHSADIVLRNNQDPIADSDTPRA